MKNFKSLQKLKPNNNHHNKTINKINKRSKLFLKINNKKKIE